MSIGSVPAHGGGTPDVVLQPGETVHAYLRRTTRAWHAAVEAAFAPFDLATRDGLGGFLRRQAAAVLPLEQAIAAAGIARLVSDWPARRRGPALFADLGVLGIARPPGPGMPDLPSSAHALGGLYVLEGSRLGGRLLLRRVLASPDPAVRAASSFLGHHQPGGWARLTAVLDAGPTDPGWLAAARAGAETAFAAFGAAAEADEGCADHAASTTPLVDFAHA